jgi:hypothetical protein
LKATDSLRELLACESQTGIRGVDRNRQRCGDFGHCLFVKIVQNEHGALVEIERLEREENELPCLTVSIAGVRSVRDVHSRVSHDFASVSRELAVLRSNPNGECEEPRLGWATWIPLTHALVNAKEDLVDRIFSIALVDPQAAKGSPEVRKVFTIEMVKVRARTRINRRARELHVRHLAMDLRTRQSIFADRPILRTPENVGIS